MGSKCFNRAPATVYRPFLTIQNTTELKQHWSSLKLYKLKKLFDAHTGSDQDKHLSYGVFISLFPQFSEKAHGYKQVHLELPQHHRKRLFELFDREGLQRIGWTQFFQALSICYHGPGQVLAALLFGLYDDKLELKLSRDQLQVLFTQNSWVVLEQYEDELLLSLEDYVPAEGMSLQEWQQKSIEWMDYQKFRRLFNVFMEEQLEKQLGQNFHDLNDCWNEQKNKSVGYMINFKWFQSWCTYMQKQYNQQIQGFSSYLTYNKTFKTLKTKKTIKSLKSGKSLNSGKSHKRLHEANRLRQLPLPPDVVTSYNHFNLVHNNIGDRPPQICNNMLEGQYSQILAPGLLENVDYVIVSEEVWRRLKLVYGAYPEFRRSGDGQIVEIYPKTFKIYTRIRKGFIDYEQQKICEFSCNMLLDQHLYRILDCTIQQIYNYRYFFKTCTINKWQQLRQLDKRISDITSEQLVFLAVVEPKQCQKFIEKNCHPAEQVDGLHLGDEFKFYDMNERQRNAILVGKGRDRMVVHFKGTSYRYDICMDRETFAERAGLIKYKTEPNRKVRMEQIYLSPIPEYIGLGFVNGILLVLFSNDNLSQFFRQKGVKQEISKNFINYLSLIYHMLSSGGDVLPSIIGDFMRIFFPEYFHFEMTMAQDFIQKLLATFLNQLVQIDKSSPFNPLKDYIIQIQQKSICSTCSQSSTDHAQHFVLSLPLQQEEYCYYEVVYIPFAHTLNTIEYLRFGFTLSKNATFNDYCRAFEEVAELKNVPYALVEVYGSDIIKCYLNALPEAPLQHLLLRQQDKIYAYELCLRLDNFILEHYTSDTNVKMRSLRQGQFIDFQAPLPKQSSLTKHTFKKLEKEPSEQKQYTFGRIVETSIESYTHKILLKVEYRDNRGQISQISINPQTYSVAPFPTQSFRCAEHYHMRCLQRVYNEASNEMQVVSQPLIIVVANWMRLREIQLLIYQQIREQIAPECRFRITEQDNSVKMNKKDKMKRFKQFLFKGKPYRLRFTDQQGRCALCCKLQKSQVLQGQEQFVCDGCEDSIDPDQPVFWTIRPYQLVISIDWNSPLSFIPPTIVDHPSCEAASTNQCPETIQRCIKRRLEDTVEEETCEKCLQEGRISSEQWISNVPERLVIVLERLHEDDYRRVNRKVVEFDMDELLMAGQSYHLVGAIGLGSRTWPLQYVAYFKDRTRWYEYENDQRRAVKRSVVQRMCAFVLFYKKNSDTFDER